MSIYVMTVGELAKKRGEPVGDFVKKVQSVGFDAGSHAKKLTQSDLDNLIGLLDGTANKPKELKKETVAITAKNPNVLKISLGEDKSIVLFVDASLNEDGSVNVSVLESLETSGIGDTILEFRKQLGMKLGVN